MMIQNKIKTIHRLGVALAAILMLLCGISATVNAETTDAELLAIPFTLNLQDQNGEAYTEAQESFTFEIRAVDDAPLPGNTTVTINTDGECSRFSSGFDAITFTEVGEYVYEIAQTSKNVTDFTIDTTVYRVVVYVVNTEAYGTRLAVEAYRLYIDEAKQENIVFKNGYVGSNTDEEESSEDPGTTDDASEITTEATDTTDGTSDSTGHSTSTTSPHSTSSPSPSGKVDAVKTGDPGATPYVILLFASILVIVITVGIRRRVSR